MVSLLQQAANPLFGLSVIALAKVVIAHAARRIDEVVGGPEPVVECAPDTIVVVHRHGVVDAQVAHRLANICLIFFKRELGGVNAKDDQAAVLVLLVPGLDVGQRTQAVDAGVGPEVDDHHLAAQGFGGERLRIGRVRQIRRVRQVNPGRRSGKIGHPLGHAVRVDRHRHPHCRIRVDSCRARMFRSRESHQSLLEFRGSGQRKPGEHAAIQPESDRRHARQYSHSEDAANPHLGA